jgi:hypothetical protein
MGSNGQRPATPIHTSAFPPAPLDAAPLAVQHALRGEIEPQGQTDAQGASCARCGDPVPLTTSSGRPRRGARYCTPKCRFAAVADRRANAYADLLLALRQLADAASRIEHDLRVMGFNPQRRRARHGRRSS